MEVVALVLSCIAIVLAAVAYWRSGGERDVAALRDELRVELDGLRRVQREMGEELSRRVRSGYEGSLSRIRRAQDRISALRAEVSTSLRGTLDVLSQQLADLRRDAEEGITKLKTGVSTGAKTTEEAVAARVRRVEGRVQVLVARAEISRAEKLAAKSQFVEAEQRLEDAVSKVREVRTRLSEEFEDDPAFSEVLDALQDAIRSVRARADDHRRQIDRVLAASDSLLASLETREH